MPISLFGLHKLVRYLIITAHFFESRDASLSIVYLEGAAPIIYCTQFFIFPVYSIYGLLLHQDPLRSLHRRSAKVIVGHCRARPRRKAPAHRAQDGHGAVQAKGPRAFSTALPGLLTLVRLRPYVRPFCRGRRNSSCCCRRSSLAVGRGEGRGRGAGGKSQHRGRRRGKHVFDPLKGVRCFDLLHPSSPWPPGRPPWETASGGFGTPLKKTRRRRQKPGV
jgi:hypothetical protein